MKEYEYSPTFMQQRSLGVKLSFFEYYYEPDMNDLEKNIIDTKVRLAVHSLRWANPKGYQELITIYDEDYDFIEGVKMGINATAYYYRFKKSIGEIIKFYTLEELEAISEDESYNILIGLKNLPRFSFFSYFYEDDMSAEEQAIINQKVEIAIKYDFLFAAHLYRNFHELYHEQSYNRRSIRLISNEERTLLDEYVERLKSLIEPYSLEELRSMYEDANSFPRLSKE